MFCATILGFSTLRVTSSSSPSTDEEDSLPEKVPKDPPAAGDDSRTTAKTTPRCDSSNLVAPVSTAIVPHAAIMFQDRDVVMGDETAHYKRLAKLPEEEEENENLPSVKRKRMMDPFFTLSPPLQLRSYPPALPTSPVRNMNTGDAPDDGNISNR